MAVSGHDVDDCHLQGIAAQQGKLHPGGPDTAAVRLSAGSESTTLLSRAVSQGLASENMLIYKPSLSDTPA